LRIQGQGFHRVFARARVEGRHDGLAATCGEARQNSRRRRRKDADTGPHTRHGPPGDLLGVLGHAARAAARLFRQLGRQGRLRAKRIGGDFRGGPRIGGGFRGGGSFHGGRSFRGGGLRGGSFRGGGLRGGNLGHLGRAASVRAVKISARLIERASGTRSRSCASQHLREWSPGSAS
jgi:hypothetical protein